MPHDQKTVYTTMWKNIPIRIVYNPDFCGMKHIELYADEPLPLTETGYRSMFVSDDELEMMGDTPAYILKVLDEESLSRKWKDNPKKQLQPCLF